MSKEVQTTSGASVSFGGVLFIVFLILKLCHAIDWSWWWVTSPLWIPIGLLIIIVVIIGILNLIFNR